jgi:hypothetical protein
MSFLTSLTEVITNNGGKGGDNRGNRRRSWRRRGTNNQEQPNRNAKAEKTRASFYERPKWIPPKTSTEPLPSFECPYCGKPIRDIASALTEKGTNIAVHFDCVLARIAEGEILEKGDVIAYIGGGRFGVVHFNHPGELKKFTIKKIFEWENKDNRAEWRTKVSDHYSVI